MKITLKKRDSVFPELNLWGLSLYSEKGLINADISEEDSKNPIKVIEKLNEILTHKSFPTL